jgi:GNAT superfamily N-acetyltransferase
MTQNSTPTLEILAETRLEKWIEANLAVRGDEEVRRLSRFWDEAQDGKRVILTAWQGDIFCGHVTLLWQSNYPPFQRLKFPEIVDLWVAENFQQQGIAKMLMTEIERLAIARDAPGVGLGVGVTGRFGPAQRLYSKFGYHPDGTGLWVSGRNISNDAAVHLDEAAMLMLAKRF